MARKKKDNSASNYKFTENHKSEYSSKLKLVIITAKNDEQKKALRVVNENKIIFLTGPAGTGKSHIAVGYALQELMKGHYKKIYFTRPYVESGEHLGFLPGGFDEKFAPFIMPMYDVVSDYFSEKEIKELMLEKIIEICPYAYMRGRTLKNCIVIGDEVQNSTPSQMRMLLTRLGENSKMILTGDLNQSDIGRNNGLIDCVNKLKGIDNLYFHNFTHAACVREKIVSDVDQRYSQNQEMIKAFDDISNTDKSS